MCFQPFLSLFFLSLPSHGVRVSCYICLGFMVSALNPIFFVKSSFLFELLGLGWVGHISLDIMGNAINPMFSQPFLSGLPCLVLIFALMVKFMGLG
jgi:hypothetical protein